MTNIRRQLTSWARGIKTDILALWIAARDRRTPLQAKLVAIIVAAYALSPVDLIPDFIPLLGYVDDLLLLPLGIAFAVWLIPRPLMNEFRARSLHLSERPTSAVMGAIIILIWLTALAGCSLWALRTL